MTGTNVKPELRNRKET